MRPLVWPGVKTRCERHGGARFVVVWTLTRQPSPCPRRWASVLPRLGLRGAGGGVVSALLPTVLCTAVPFSARSASNKRLIRFRLLSSPSYRTHFSLGFWVAALSQLTPASRPSPDARLWGEADRHLRTGVPRPRHITSHNSPLVAGAMVVTSFLQELKKSEVSLSFYMSENLSKH